MNVIAAVLKANSSEDKSHRKVPSVLLKTPKYVVKRETLFFFE